MIKHFYSKIYARLPILDIRAIGLFRIALGIALLYNLIFYRYAAVGFFYGADRGISYTVADPFFGEITSFFQYIESPAMLYALMTVMLILTIAFIAGFKTRLITPLLFFLYGSIFALNPYLVHGVEFLEEVALFWAMFLPLDQSYTVPWKRSSKRVTPSKFVSFCFIFQLFLIYTSSWIFKDGEIWQTGKVLEMVSYDLIHAKPLLVFIAQNSSAAMILTYCGFFIEVLISLFLFLTLLGLRVRISTSIMMFSLHAMMGVMLHVGSFFPVGLAFSLLLLPASVFSRLKFLSALDVTDYSLRPTTQVFSRYNKVVLLLILLFFTRNNLHHWSKNSYASDVLMAVPFYKYTIGWHYADPGIFSGLWHQAWKFFPNNLYSDLGDFKYIGVTYDDKNIDLRSGREVVKNQLNGAVNFDELSSNNYHGAEFTFAVYFKFYYDRFPESVKENWLKWQLQQYQQSHPEVSLTRIELYKIKRDLKYIDHKPTTIDSVFLLIKEDMKP